MTIRKAGGLVLLALFAPAVAAHALPGAQTGADTSEIAGLSTFTVQPESKLWLEGNSTVRRYRCEATRLDATVEADAANRSVALSELERAVRGVRVQVPVAELRCGDNTMDGHMRKALKVESHPSIQFRLVSHEVVQAGEAKATVKMMGALNIAGKENTISIDATAVPGPDATVRVTGSRELRMTEFGVRPPTLMLGTLKVRDEVTVHFDITLKS